jgi:hypothetical protein
MTNCKKQIPILLKINVELKTQLKQILDYKVNEVNKTKKP